MAPTTTTILNVAIRSELPGSVEASAVLELIQDHDAYMSLDGHLLERTRLGKQSVEAGADVAGFPGVSEWLRAEMQRIVRDLGAAAASESEARAQRSWDVEFWELQIANPLGKLLGNLK